MLSGEACWGIEDMVRGADGLRRFQDASQSLYHQLSRTAAVRPDHLAVADDAGNRVTYRELLELVDNAAAYLKNVAAVGEGDRVALLLHAGVAYVVAVYAANKLGAAAVAVPTKCRRDEAVTLLFAADVTHVAADPEFDPWKPILPVEASRIIETQTLLSAPEAPVALAPQGQSQSVALMMFTSGTTSAAKAVELTNENVVHAAIAYARLCGTTPADSCLICLPIYYVTGLVALMAQFVYVGAAMHIHSRFDPEHAVAAVESESITYLHGAPTAFARMLSCREAHPFLPSLRLILSGSSKETLSTLSQWHSWAPQAEYRVVYGLTETASPALLFPGDTPSSANPLATGLPFPGMDCKVVDEQGNEVPNGALGELWVRGTNVTRGYYRRPTTALKPGGWLGTGDVARVEDGLVWIVDRIKDMINRGGEKVWCSSLEEHLAGVDGVVASCVSRIPHEDYGEVPVAAVVTRPGSALTEDEIKLQLKRRIASFEVPEHVIFVDELPLTPASKPDRAAVSRAVLTSQEERTILHGARS